MRSTKVINWLSFILVGLLAAGSFVLSYNALWDTAILMGVPPRLAWIWPLLVDFALIVFSLAVVRSSLYGDRVVWGWFLVAVYTLATVAFNVLHAPDNLTARIVAVVAPVSLFLSFETLMAMLKGEVNRSEAIKSLSAILAQKAEIEREMKEFQREAVKRVEGEATQLKAELDAELNRVQQEHDTAIEASRLELDTLTQEIATLQAQAGKTRQELQDITRQAEERQAEIKATQDGHLVDVWSLVNHVDASHLDTTTRQVLTAILVNAGVTQKDIAGWSGVSVKTVQRDIQGSNGLIKK